MFTCTISIDLNVELDAYPRNKNPNIVIATGYSYKYSQFLCMFVFDTINIIVQVA